jgi:1-deoxy-D-xylulose-5-phosphate reductoisomerase
VPPARIVLTASGGPFLKYSKADLAEVTATQALKHPSWQMGKKVTIDSATLMNKGLEVIEAHRLFDVPYENISVLVHPQSIVHSIVEFVDGSAKAQLGWPDMRLPIQYALTYPERKESFFAQIDLIKAGKLTFFEPEGDTYPAVLCAADEVVVGLFLSGAIGFNDIPALIQRVLDAHQPTAKPNVEDIATADAWARHTVGELSTKGAS